MRIRKKIEILVIKFRNFQLQKIYNNSNSFNQETCLFVYSDLYKCFTNMTIVTIHKRLMHLKFSTQSKTKFVQKMVFLQHSTPASAFNFASSRTQYKMFDDYFVSRYVHNIICATKENSISAQKVRNRFVPQSLYLSSNGNVICLFVHNCDPWDPPT